MLGPFASDEGGPITRAGEAFAIGGVEAEGHGEAAFAEGGMGGDGEAVVELDLIPLPFRVIFAHGDQDNHLRTRCLRETAEG